MKKVLTIIASVAIMTTSAMATWHDGTIGAIMQFPSFTKVILIKDDGTSINNKVSGDAEVQKRILAMMLMAKSQNLPVRLADTAGGKWNGIIIP